MVVDLNGIVFSQIYGDNSGGTEFDTDGDGTPTQEDEFVSLLNTTGSSIDISGWQIWSDMTGAGAPDGPQDGLYHTFPPGTVIAPGANLYVINEISGTPAANMQEASEGGVESGSGSPNTNFLSEGDDTTPESVALVNPSTGEYIIINMSIDLPSNIPGEAGFPGTVLIGESNVVTDSGVEDQNANSSFQYNAVTDSYDYGTVFVACFAAGTLMTLPDREAVIEDLRVGDVVQTLDNGPQPIRMILRRDLDFMSGDDPRHKPIEIAQGALGHGRPRRRLIVSPQHRMLVQTADQTDVLAPAKGLTGRKGIRQKKGMRKITYIHLVFGAHEIVCSEGCWSESFYPGQLAISNIDAPMKSEMLALYPELTSGSDALAARPIVKVREARTLELQSTHCL